MSEAPSDGPGHLEALIDARLGRFIYRSTSVQESDEHGSVDRSLLIRLFRFLKSDRDAHLDMLVDVFATDFGPTENESNTRFSVTYRLRSSRLPYRLTVTTSISEREATYPSIIAVYPSAVWYEREVFDLFGLRAEGHPNLRRLLLYPGFAGHPMRKDYPLHKSQPLVPLRKVAAPAKVFGGDV